MLAKNRIFIPDKDPRHQAINPSFLEFDALFASSPLISIILINVQTLSRSPHKRRMLMHNVQKKPYSIFYPWFARNQSHAWSINHRRSIHPD